MWLHIVCMFCGYMTLQSDDKSVRVWRTRDWQEESCIEEPFLEVRVRLLLLVIVVKILQTCENKKDTDLSCIIITI